MLPHADVLLAVRNQVISRGFPELTGTTLGADRKTLVGAAVHKVASPGAQVELEWDDGSKVYHNVFRWSGNDAILLDTVELNGTLEHIRVAPRIRSWTNVPVKDQCPEDFEIREDYTPGPSYKIGLGPGGRVEYYPMYVLRLEGLTGIGEEAIFRLADAIVGVFPPQHVIKDDQGNAVSIGGHAIRVRGRPGPYRTQVVRIDNKAGTTISIPLLVRLPGGEDA